MGQKVHPNGIRLQITKGYHSVWFADSKNYALNVESDHSIRKFLNKKLANASVSKIIIERPAKSIRITIHTARPGVVIGKKGEDVEKLRVAIEKITGLPVQLNISEIRKPEVDSKLVAEGIANQLEKRVLFRRAMKRAVQNALRAGAKGIKVAVAGRVGGAEIARTEWYREGRVPLHTFRADIDYATAEALTTYGILGIKVWIFKGEVFEKLPISANEAIAEKKSPVKRSPKRTKSNKSSK